MGGGTGLATLLRGLKRYVQATDGALEITAVVTVTDDGGSSGRLRREFDVLPPGDIRSCMVALCQDETLLSRLFNYRFTGGRGLKGHSFGNLFLTAMTHLTGDFAHAVKLSSEVLAVRGRIFPSTAADVRLEATLVGGKKVSGETRISRSTRPIERADLITLGPGSLYTSVIPHLLVQGIPEALAASPAVKAYFTNLMTQPGETTGMRASDHMAALLHHAGPRSRRFMDVCVVNTGSILQRALERYRAREARPVENDASNLEAMGVKVLTADLVRMAGRRVQTRIRHDPGAVSAVAVQLAQQGRRAKERLAS